MGSLASLILFYISVHAFNSDVQTSDHFSITLHFLKALSSAGQGMSLKNLTSFCSNLNLASVTDVKRIQTAHSLCCDFQGYKTFTTSLSPSLSSCRSSGNLFEGSPALLAQVGQASTNTGCFLIFSSSCWQ